MKMKKLRLPHTLVLIYTMVVLTVIATWIVPGGEYQRVEKEGRTIPVEGSFQFVESRPRGWEPFLFRRSRVLSKPHIS